MDNLSAVLHGPRDIRLEHRPTPEPPPGGALVKVTAVGVCGSDMHYYFDGHLGDWWITQPIVLGHETAGVVAALGDGVTDLTLGQRVAVEPGFACLRCERCRAGRYNLCPNMVFFSHPPIDGTFCQYVTAPRAFIHPLPDNVSDDAAAMLEPFSVGMWAARRGNVNPGDHVLIVGCGPIGLLAMLAARTYGATEITMVDVAEPRLALARHLGASATINSATTELATAGIEATVLIECSGNPKATSDAIRNVARGGAAVLVGLGPDSDYPLPAFELIARELTVSGSFRYANTWPTAIRLLASGTVNLDQMVTDHFPLARTADALEAARRDPTFLKAVVRPHD